MRSAAGTAWVAASAATPYCAVARARRSYSPMTPSSMVRAVAASSRWAGSLRSRPETTGCSNASPLSGGTGSVITAVSVDSAEPLSYGGTPSTIAYKVAPSDHRSAGGPGTPPRARSGEMYDGAPTSMPVDVTDGSPSTRAIPKSVSTTRPSCPISTFDGFTSRCRMPTRCASASTPSSSNATSAARCGGSTPSVRMTSLSERDSISSITIQGRPSSSTTSYTVTAPLCRIRAMAFASVSVRATSRCRSSSSTPPANRSSLTATSRPRNSSAARQTVPIPPWPRTAVSRYRDARSFPLDSCGVSSRC